MPGTMQLLTLTLSSLLISSTQAAKCGSMTVTQCTDSECSVGCTTYEYQPEDCGKSYLQQTVSSGGTSASCTRETISFHFYPTDDCLSTQNQDAQTYDFGVCKINDLGSAKIEPLGEQPEQFELTQAEYEERFNQRFTWDSKFNVIGYGMENKYVPPLQGPEWLLSELDRYSVVSRTAPWAPFMTQAFIGSLGDFSQWNGFWYNNDGAAGEQLYPDGPSKYFDMFSISGVTNFLIYWVWYRICDFSRPILILPANVWLAILNGDKFDEIWKVLIPDIIAWYFHVRGEKGWVLG